MRLIKVKTQFIGFHKWKDAPQEVVFLRNPHRHVFYVVAKIEVNGDDRELEYFMVQKLLDTIIEEYVTLMPMTKSCEQMAELILNKLEIMYGAHRIIQVEVNEDNENGSICTNTNKII